MLKSPPFSITPKVLDTSLALGQAIGHLTGLSALRPQPRLRKENRVRTVQGTVSIEGNPLSEEQVTAVLEGKRVLGARRAILEVQNANIAYEQAPFWNPWSERDLLSAHAALMKGLLLEAGQWRRGGVGVLHGTKVAHVAPPAKQVPRLMEDLLQWGKEGDAPLLIKACVVHYEIQFIHPFIDGNGRLGRLWQHVILLGVSPVFQFVPVESLIRARQADYYAALGESDSTGSSTRFLEFSLTTLLEALQELLGTVRVQRETGTARLHAARQVLGQRWFTRGDYLRVRTELSTATASRDLKEGVQEGVLTKKGERRTTLYAFKS